jgi:hypothetical protein
MLKKSKQAINFIENGNFAFIFTPLMKHVDEKSFWFCYPKYSNHTSSFQNITQGLTRDKFILVVYYCGSAL